MGQPTTDVRILALGKDSKINSLKVTSVKILGSKEELSWKQAADALIISKPAKLPDWQVVTFKIELK